MTSRETKSLANTEDKSSGVSNDVLIESLRYQLAQLNPEERMEFGGQEMFNFVMRPVYNSKDKKMSIELLLYISSYISSLIAGCACQMAAMADDPGQFSPCELKVVRHTMPAMQSYRSYLANSTRHGLSLAEV